MTMERGLNNIYKTSRLAKGFTQERWAELLGLSVTSVSNYENGLQIPGDDVVLNMAMISGDEALLMRHMLATSNIARMTFPEIQLDMPLERATLVLMTRIKAYSDEQYEMLGLVEDGKITEDELADWEGVMEKLDALIVAAMQLKFSQIKKG